MKLKLGFRTIFWGAAALILLALLVLAFRPRSIPVDTAVATRGEMVVTVQDEARARVREVYVLSAPVAGQLLRVDKEAGDPVAEGEPAARLLPPAPAFLDSRSRDEARAAVTAAEAALAAAGDRAAQAAADRELAATEAERYEELAERGVAPIATRDRARRDLRAAEAALAAANAERRARQAELEAARARLADPAESDGPAGTVAITSPVAGRVLRVRQESEAVVAAGQPILEVGDPADLEIVAEMLSSDAAKIAEGAEALIESWGGEPDPLPGHVRRVEPSGFTKISALGVEEQRVNVLIDLDDPLAAARAGLGDGWRVEAAVVIWRGDSVLQAPVSALFRDGEGWAVFRIAGGRAALTPVRIGRDNGDVAEILDGLSEGDRLVLYPGEQISDGARVTGREDG